MDFMNLFFSDLSKILKRDSERPKLSQTAKSEAKQEAPSECPDALRERTVAEFRSMMSAPRARIEELTRQYEAGEIEFEPDQDLVHQINDEEDPT